MISEDTIGKMFWNRVRQHGPRAALRAKRAGRWQDISWEEWGRNVKQFAMGLMALGLKERQTVALLSENRPEWTYVDLAVLSANAVDTPIYATNRPDWSEFSGPGGLCTGERDSCRTPETTHRAPAGPAPFSGGH